MSDRPAATAAKHWDTVAIVGVGLIGGSIGIDLLRRGLARHVVGIGRREESLKVAQRVGAVSSITLDLPSGLADAQLVVVCTPVSRIAEDVRQVARFCRLHTLITDAGSTKQAIVEELDRDLSHETRYVGSHPLAGSERSGAGAAMPELFQGRVAIVTPGARAREEDTAAVSAFWESLGARVLRMTAAEHDRQIASASHLPHLAAAAVAAATPQECLPLVAGGWLDTTRVAAGDPALWRDILLANRENCMAALAAYEEVLARFRAALSQRNDSALEQVLQEAKLKRDAVGS